MRLHLQRFNNRRGLLALALVLLVLGAAGISVVATISFTTVKVDRSVSADVVSERQGYVTTDVVDCIPNRAQERLATVTSRLDTSAQLVVTLNEPTIGTLHAEGQSGDIIRLNIDPKESVDIELEATARGPFPNEFTFDVSVVVSPLTLSTTHNSKVDLPKPRGCDGSAGRDGTNNSR